MRTSYASAHAAGGPQPQDKNKTPTVTCIGAISERGGHFAAPTRTPLYTLMAIMARARLGYVRIQCYSII